MRIGLFICFSIIYCSSIFAQDGKVIADELLSQVKVDNLSSLNTKYHEFSPSFYKDGLLYVSSSPETSSIDNDTGEAFWDLFYAVKDENKSMIKLGVFSDNLNSPSHEGPAGFNSTEDVVYFTRNRNIFTSNHSNGVWTEPTEVEFESNEFYYCHPTLREDGAAMIFASNLPGGFGEMDLYISYWNGINWSLPQNMGPSINTSGNDLFPFWHASGMLFYSSDGRKGKLGGLDIYVSDLENGIWRVSQNMGVHVNSKKDDFGFILSDSGTEAYISSNRNGGKGKDDIYRLFFKHDLNKRQIKDLISLEIFTSEKEGGNPIENAQIEIISNEGEELSEALFSDEDGKVRVEIPAGRAYIFRVSKKGFETLTEIVDKLDQENMAISLNRTEIECVDYASLILNENNQVIKGASMRISSSCLGSELYEETDDNGYSLFCIPPSCSYDVRISAEGYREYEATIQVTADNSRRPGRFVLASKEALPPLIKEDELKKGAVIVLNNIYYETNKSDIIPGAARELDQLADIMLKYPEMQIQLSAHTDSRGEEKYNLNLSTRRANSASAYLVRKGIDIKRITAVGFGEQFIRNQCREGVNCSDEEHRYNRRTEVKVLNINKDVEVKYNQRN